MTYSRLQLHPLCLTVEQILELANHKKKPLILSFCFLLPLPASISPLSLQKRANLNGNQPAMADQAAVRPDASSSIEAAQLGERDPNAGNVVRDSPCSCFRGPT